MHNFVVSACDDSNCDECDADIADIAVWEACDPGNYLVGGSCKGNMACFRHFVPRM